MVAWQEGAVDVPSLKPAHCATKAKEPRHCTKGMPERDGHWGKSVRPGGLVSLPPIDLCSFQRMYLICAVAKGNDFWCFASMSELLWFGEQPRVSGMIIFFLLNGGFRGFLRFTLQTYKKLKE